MNNTRSVASLIGIAVVAAAASLLWGGGNSSFTLYRSSALDANMRIHVATFDTKNGEPYNRENCEIAAGLFLGQPGVTVKYWCEKGGFRK